MQEHVTFNVEKCSITKKKSRYTVRTLKGNWIKVSEKGLILFNTYYLAQEGGIKKLIVKKNQLFIHLSTSFYLLLKCVSIFIINKTHTVSDANESNFIILFRRREREIWKGMFTTCLLGSGYLRMLNLIRKHICVAEYSLHKHTKGCFNVIILEIQYQNSVG